MSNLKKALEGEHWKGLTPLLLCVLTATLSLCSAFGFWILNDVRHDVRMNTQYVSEVISRLNGHIESPELHYNIAKDVEWLKKSFTVKNAYAGEEQP